VLPVLHLSSAYSNEKRQMNRLKDRFTKDAAAKTGKPERSIQRDATRAKALAPDLDRIIGSTMGRTHEHDRPSTGGSRPQ
jgi:hypothetical protein